MKQKQKKNRTERRANVSGNKKLITFSFFYSFFLRIFSVLHFSRKIFPFISYANFSVAFQVYIHTYEYVTNILFSCFKIYSLRTYIYARTLSTYKLSVQKRFRSRRKIFPMFYLVVDFGVIILFLFKFLSSKRSALWRFFYQQNKRKRNWKRSLFMVQRIKIHTKN